MAFRTDRRLTGPKPQGTLRNQMREGKAKSVEREVMNNMVEPKEAR